MRDAERFAVRRWHWIGALGLALALLVGRAAQLQLFSLKLRQQAERNTIRQVEVIPPRGTLRDRKERLWVSNVPFFNVFFTRKTAPGLVPTALAQWYRLPPPPLPQRRPNPPHNGRTNPTHIALYVSLARYAPLLEHQWHQTGFSAQVLNTRRYLYPTGAAFLGYLNEVTPAEIAASQGKYSLGNLIGRSGLERQYESLLAGRKGYRFVVVDAWGRELYSYQEGKHDIPPVRGLDLVLTVDADLQQFAESLFYGKVGALVAIEPATGEILCAVSSPVYDPNRLAGENVNLEWANLNKAPHLPLYNRAIQGLYPPGSTFKLLNALIALQESTLTPSGVYPCAGGFIRNQGKPACHAHPTPLDLIGAIQHSCNAYFASLFVDLLNHPKYSSIREAYQRWREYLHYLGVGRRLGVDIPGEKPGNLPKPDFYDRIYGKNRWNAFTILSNSIGQGEVLMTPLQMANAMCLIANRGYYIQPHFLRYVYLQPHKQVTYFDTLWVPIDRRHFDVIIESMRLAVEAGTGYTAYVPGLGLCGKTGTAQNPHGADHSVFVGFAPYDDPKIALAVIVENGGWGASWAAPIASLVVEKYLTGRVSRPHLLDYVKNTALLPP